MPSGRCLPLLSVGHMMDSMEDAKMQNGQGQQVLEIPYVEERSNCNITAKCYQKPNF